MTLQAALLQQKGALLYNRMESTWFEQSQEVSRLAHQTPIQLGHFSPGLWNTFAMPNKLRLVGDGSKVSMSGQHHVE
jgi:hypothetical protein